MPDKKQYDDELVQLLARGELADREIAKRLGLNPSQVSRIARGEIRGDLQPKILAAMRKTLKAAWKKGGRLDTDSGQATPGARPAPGTAKTAFDRHLAVELIASGQLTLSKIAERLGVHKTTVSHIMAGRSHPELQGLIREAEKHYRDRARRIGVKWSAQIVMKQIQVGLKDNGWVGLRARQDLLDRFLSPEDERGENEVPPAERDFGIELRDLPEPLKSQVVEALGGPAADEEEVEYKSWVEPGMTTVPPDGSPSDGYEEVSHTPACPTGVGQALGPVGVGRRPPPAASAPQKNDVAQPPSAEQEQKNDVAQPPSAEQEHKNDVTQPPSAEPFDRLDPSTKLRNCVKLGTGAAQGKPFDAAQGKQEQATPLEEGCSRNKKRRRRMRAGRRS